MKQWSTSNVQLQALWLAWRIFLRLTRKPRRPFWALKAIFSSSVSKNGEVYAPETSCMKEPLGVYVKNMWIKQLFNRMVPDFAIALRARMFPGFSRNGPQVRKSNLGTDHRAPISWCHLHFLELEKLNFTSDDFFYLLVLPLQFCDQAADREWSYPTQHCLRRWPTKQSTTYINNIFVLEAQISITLKIRFVNL